MALVLVAAIAGLWLTERLFGLVYRIADILLIFGLAWLLKLLLDPLTRRLQSWRLPRGVSIAVSYLVLVGALVGVLLWLLPQLTSVAQRIPALASQAAGRANDVTLWLQARGIEVDTQGLRGQIVGLGGQIGSRVASTALTAAQDFLEILGKLGLVITVSIYMSLTTKSFADGMRPIIPPRWRDEFDAFVDDVNKAYSSYIRGYFYIVALGTLMSAVILFGFRTPGAFLWLAAIFVVRLLPFIGGTLSDVLNILAVLIGLPLWPQAAIAIALVIIGQVLLTNVVMPRVMSRELGISPLLVLFAVLLGARIYGVAGILFAIPAAAVIATFVGRAVTRYLAPLYERRGWWGEEVTLFNRHDPAVEAVLPPAVTPAVGRERPVDDEGRVRRPAEA